MNPGIRFMLLATLFFALMNVLVKWLDRLPVFEIIFFRSLVSVILSVAIIKKANLSLLGNNMKLLILRGVFGFLGLLFYFITVKHIPLASAVTIQYLSPVFSTILAIVILHQRMPAINWLFYLIAFSGIFMVEGFDHRIDITMLGVGIASALFSALAYNMIGKLKGQDDPRVVVLYFPLVTLPLSIVPMLMSWVQPTWMEWLILLGVGAATQLGQLYMTWAFQSGDIGKVAIFQYLGMVYALLMGYFLFGESFNAYSITGMLLVVAGVVISALYSVWENKKLSRQQ